MSEITVEQTFSQLAYIKSRLETYPLANHECTCLKDCMILLIRTFAGEVIPGAQLANIGGGIVSDPANGSEHREVFVGGEMRNGVEIAPGVIQYPAPPDPNTMDIGAAEREHGKSLAPSRPPVPSGMPKPVKGSLMAVAMDAMGSDGDAVSESGVEVTS